MKKLIIGVALCVCGSVFGQGQALGELIGTVVDPSDKSGIPDAIVWIEDDGKMYRGVTDLDGRFRISAIPSGNYFAFISNRIDTIKTKVVNIPPDGFGNLGTIPFQLNITQLDVVVVGGDRVHDELTLLITNATPYCTLKSEDIKKMGVKFDMKAMLAVMSSDVKQGADGELYFRGSRKGDMIYYLDGVKIAETQNTPSCSINNITMYTGGIPAKYGDTTGGVVVVDTKSYFDLLREYRIQSTKE